MPKKYKEARNRAMKLSYSRVVGRLYLRADHVLLSSWSKPGRLEHVQSEGKKISLP